MLSVAPVIVALCLGQTEPTSVHLFHSGNEGYPRYRIPSLLVTTKGTVLAICEGRKDGRGLTGDIDIVVKRSVDGGKTWKPLAVVADDGAHTLGNPCAVVDRRDGRIWLLLTRSHGKDVEDDIVAGTSRETTRVLVTSSKDDGLTWEPLRDITASAAAPSWRWWYGTGPGIGIQLESGRLLIPAYHSEARTKLYRSHAIYSDDRGETWKRGESTGEHASESQAVERADGSIRLNARTNDEGPKLRTVADSKDGGATWSEGRHDKDLFDPHCQASIYRLTTAKEGKTRWLFCHPAGPGRRNLTIRLSYDEGKSWPIARQVRDGDSQYSCMTRLSGNTIGLLHESWVDNNYQIYFVRFGLDWLTEGKDSLAAP